MATYAKNVIGSERSRYLLWFSYVGTRFFGVQKQPEATTVQGILERGLSVLLEVGREDIRTMVSSRTDTGVHALMNTALLDLPLRSGKNPGRYDAGQLAAGLNHLLSQLNVDIRVLGARQVSHGFCARKHAKSRTYLYRLAVLKAANGQEYVDPAELAPLAEWNRSWILGPGFDFETCRKTARLFLGQNNLASFMAPPRNHSMTDVSETIRTLGRINVEQTRSLLDPEIDPRSVSFDNFNIHVESRSFLYRQIRRMVAVLVAVACRQMNLADVHWLLQNPNPFNFRKFGLELAPACGLYLKDIQYNPRDFDDPKPFISKGWVRKEAK